MSGFRLRLNRDYAMDHMTQKKLFFLTLFFLLACVGCATPITGNLVDACQHHCDDAELNGRIYTECMERCNGPIQEP